MNPVAFLGGPPFNYLDHLAPLSYFLKCPLIVEDYECYKLGLRHYPNVNIQLQTINFMEIAKQYNLILLSTQRTIIETKAILQLVNANHVRFCYCHHGQSDKIAASRDLPSLSERDITLLYGERQNNMLKLNRSNKYHKFMIGNYRLAYYDKYREKLSALTKNEIFQQMDINKKTILYAPTWTDNDNNYNSTTFFLFCEELINKLPDNYNLIVKLHPLLERYNTAHTYKILSYDNCKQNVRVIFNFPPIYQLLDKIDIYLGDYSSVGYDFLYFNKPMFFLPTKKVNLHKCGMNVPSIDEFFKHIGNDQSHLSKIRKAYYNESFSPFDQTTPLYDRFQAIDQKVITLL